MRAFSPSDGRYQQTERVTNYCMAKKWVFGIKSIKINNAGYSPDLGKLIFGLPKFQLNLIAVGDRENSMNFPG